MISQQVDAAAIPAARGAQRSLDALADLARFGGTPAEFWPLYLATLSQCLSVRRCLLLLRSPEAGWRAACQWPANASGPATDAAKILRLADAALTPGAAGGSLGQVAQAGAGLGASLRSLPALAAADTDAAVLVLLCELEDAELLARLPLLRLALETPEQYTLERRLHNVAGNAERLHEATSLAIRLGDEERFLKAAMLLCGELAARFGCDGSRWAGWRAIWCGCGRSATSKSSTAAWPRPRRWKT
jgi:hypothetical protein